MRVVKLALISFFVFFALLTSISLFIPSSIRISKATNLYASPEKALGYIKDTSRWKEWHPLYQQMVTQERTAHYDIALQNETDSSLQFNTRYKGQIPIISGFQVYRFPSTDSLTVQWYMDFKLPWYPWQKFGSLFYENTYGQMMQNGLAELKKSLEE